MPTLPVLMARASTDPADARLHELLAGDLTDDSAHAEALDLLRKHPAMDEARAYVVARAAEAKALLEALPSGPVREALESFADIVATRSACDGRSSSARFATSVPRIVVGAADAPLSGQRATQLRAEASAASRSCRRRWPSASTVKMARASQTRTKPNQRPAGMSSSNQNTPRANWMIGARYCSRPELHHRDPHGGGAEAQQRDGGDDPGRHQQQGVVEAVRGEVA